MADANLQNDVDAAECGVRILTAPFTRDNFMYAIISDGSRQYKVEEGQELLMDYREAKPGEKLKFEQVLAVGGEGDVKLGAPLVKGASVTAEVLGPVKGEKHVVQILRRRKNMRHKTGFRAIHTRVKIAKITG
jgi:large subunit ribosomal protein L21